MNQLDVDKAVTVFTGSKYLLEFEVNVVGEHMAYPIFMGNLSNTGTVHSMYHMETKLNGAEESNRFMLKEGYSYQSMTALVQVSTGNGTRRNQQIIIDSGAAWCAIGARACRRDYPHVWATLVAADKIFINASNARMVPITGGGQDDHLVTRIWYDSLRVRF